jgi:hypothetical protein
MKIHKLKTLQPYYDEVLKGRKTFELRKDDRNFVVGDFLQLFEGNEQVEDIQLRSNKNFIYFQICYKLDGGIYGLEKGFCILGITRDISDYEYRLLNNMYPR